MQRTAAQRFAGRVTTALAVLVLSAFALFALTLRYELSREVWLIRATGWAALAALFLALAVTPIHRARRRAAPGFVGAGALVAFRRSFGIGSAALALGHAALVFATYLRGSWAATFEHPYLRAGLTALVILAVLLVTSFPEIVALLRVKLWKELHRLSYAAAFFVLWHLLQSPFASRRLTLALFGALLSVEVLRLVPRKKPLPAGKGA